MHGDVASTIGRTNIVALSYIRRRRRKHFRLSESKQKFLGLEYA